MAELTPRVTAMETAHKTDNFPPKPGGLCYEYCDVIDLRVSRQATTTVTHGVSHAIDRT